MVHISDPKQIHFKQLFEFTQFNVSMGPWSHNNCSEAVDWWPWNSDL